MSEPYLGEIRMFPTDFAPSGWAFCVGQTLPIAQNQALFALLGTVYGGDGKTTFALPDLRGRAPVHFGTTLKLGEASGEATHTLTVNEMPLHTHLVQGSTATSTDASPTNNVWANSDTVNLYGPASALALMNPQSISTVGGGQAHTNMQPYLTLNFCIALKGIFPTRN